MTLAGQPTATQFSGIFFVTTLPAPFNFNKYFKTYNCCIFSNIYACTLKINFYFSHLHNCRVSTAVLLEYLNKNLILTSSNFFRFLQVKLSLELRPALLHSLSE